MTLYFVASVVKIYECVSVVGVVEAEHGTSFVFAHIFNRRTHVAVYVENHGVVVLGSLAGQFRERRRLAWRADVGIVGKDVLIEEAPGADVYEVMDLGIGRCRMAVAGIAGKKVDMTKRITIGTKYPRIARAYFEANHHSVDIIKLNGSVELAPIVGLSDVIVDIVETGNTLKANGLEVLKYFMDFSARMICNPVSFKMKYNEIQQLMEVIREHSMKA